MTSASPATKAKGPTRRARTHRMPIAISTSTGHTPAVMARPKSTPQATRESIAQANRAAVHRATANRSHETRPDATTSGHAATNITSQLRTRPATVVAIDVALSRPINRVQATMTSRQTNNSTAATNRKTEAPSTTCWALGAVRSAPKRADTRCTSQMKTPVSGGQFWSVRRRGEAPVPSEVFW